MTESSTGSKKLPLTFGIEIEFLFGIRRGFESKYLDHQWLVQLDVINDPEPEEGPFPRGLVQASKIFTRGSGEHIVVSGKGPDSLYKCSKWNLTTEGAVNIPEDGLAMAIFSNDVLGDHEDPDEWDWSGLELISPILTVPDLDSNSYRPNGMVEVKDYLNMMTQEIPPNAPYVMLAGPEVTGIHVHMGVQPDESGQIEFPLDVLRHIAFLSLFFEDTITLLHHPHRRTYPDSKCRVHCTPNRHILMAKHSKDIVHTCKDGEEFDPQDAFMKIFNYKYDNEKDARGQLCDMLSSKKTYKEGEIFLDDILRSLYVNFENIANAVADSDKRTVEFRQHHGTKSAYDLEQWVVFLTALVRAAERLSQETPSSSSVPPKLYSKIYSKYSREPAKRDRALAEAAKYSYLLRQDQRSLKQLFDVLQLPIDRRRYWWDRTRAIREVFVYEWADRSHSICDIDCGNPPIRDCVGYEDGELDHPPWDKADADEKEEGQSDDGSDTSSDPEDLALSPTPSLVADDNDGEPMEIDDDVPSTRAVTPRPAAVDIMSISHLLNHEKSC